MIQVIDGKDAFWEVDKYDVAFIGCSTYCMIDGGFGGKLKNRFPVIQEADDLTPYADTRKLGKRLTINDTTPVFSLFYICNYPHGGRECVDYDALEHALLTANAEFKGKRIISTILGAGPFDGNGDKDKCLQLMRDCCKDLDIDVYDYRQLSMTEEKRIIFELIKSIYKVDPGINKYLYDHQSDLAEMLYIIRGTK